MEPLSIAAAALGRAADPAASEGIKVSGRLLERLVGPGVDELSQQWASHLRQKNLQRLLKKSDARAQGAAPGTVPPRLASQVFEAAQFADDELMAEYFSGVLSSSRDETGGNDAGVSWAALIARLSSDQIRLHYLIYSCIRPAAIARGVERVNKLHSEKVLIALTELLVGFQLSPNVVNRFADAIDGLMREGLIGDGYSYGPLQGVKEEYAKDMLLVAPFDRALRVGLSIHGMRLFVWGLGSGQIGIGEYINPTTVLQVVDASAALPIVPRAGLYEDFLQPVGSSGDAVDVAPGT
jgi:hypothetical protein